MSFSVNYLVFCVPTLHINNYRNRDIVLNTLIAEFITLCVKHHMAGKVPKSKDFYKVSLCSNTIVSTCVGTEPEYYMAKVITQYYPHLLPKSIAIFQFIPPDDFYPILAVFTPFLEAQPQPYTLAKLLLILFRH